MKAPRSLQGRVLGLVIGVVTAIWVATALAVYVDARHELDELLDAHLAQAAALLIVQHPGAFEDDDETEPAPTLHRYAPKVAFQVFHEGRLVTRSSNAPAQPMRRLGGAGLAGFATERIDGTRWRIFAAYGHEDDVQVLVGEHVGSRDSILQALLRSFLTPLLVGVPLLAMAAWWAVRRGLVPLRTLGATLAGRDPSALQAVELPAAPSEMQPMLAALNGLFRRIEALLASERRFTADAAHELRTPIAAIRAQAQVALGAADGAQRDHALHATLDACDRATRLVGQLLTLARLEAGDDGPPGRADLAEITRRTIGELAPVALRRGQRLGLQAEGDTAVRGDATLLSVLVRNLLDNAMRYGPDGAVIDVLVDGRPDAAAADRVRWRIDDSGPGLPSELLGRLGERFFRVAGSRAPGSGLGWSIVRRVAQAHGAGVEVGVSRTLGGLAVAIDFERPPAAG